MIDRFFQLRLLQISLSLDVLSLSLLKVGGLVGEDFALTKPTPHKMPAIAVCVRFPNIPPEQSGARYRSGSVHLTSGLSGDKAG